jgi:hypothetical protein
MSKSYVHYYHKKTLNAFHYLFDVCLMKTQTALCNLRRLSYRTLKPIDQYVGRSDFNHGLYQHIKYHAETTMAWVQLESQVCNGGIHVNEKVEF